MATVKNLLSAMIDKINATPKTVNGIAPDVNGNIEVAGGGGGNECTWETIKNNSFAPEVTTYESKVICENVNISDGDIPVGEDGLASEYLIGGCVYDVVISDGENILDTGVYIHDAGMLSYYYYSGITVGSGNDTVRINFSSNTENKCIHLYIPITPDYDLYLTLTRREYTAEKHKSIDVSSLPFILFYKETITVGEDERDMWKCTKTYEECAELIDTGMFVAFVAHGYYSGSTMIYGAIKNWENELEFYLSPSGQYPQNRLCYRQFDGIYTYEYSGA